MKENLPSTKILGTNITVASKEQILEYIFKCIDTKSKKVVIVTPNPEMLVYATRSRSFQDLLNSADISLADGIGVTIAGNMLKKDKIKRITGADMMVELCSQASKRGVTVGFLGGRDGVAELTSERLTKKYPNLIVSFIGEEWPAKMTNGQWPMAKKESEFNKNLLTINHQSSTIPHVDILFVAFGFPKQEEWIAKNLSHISVTVAMGVGGAFDYVSGRVPRAPKIVRNVGMEWAFRLLIQPWRIKRQMALPIFVGKVLKEKFSKQL